MTRICYNIIFIYLIKNRIKNALIEKAEKIIKSNQIKKDYEDIENFFENFQEYQK